jgi:hypothetical protein
MSLWCESTFIVDVWMLFFVLYFTSEKLMRGFSVVVYNNNIKKKNITTVVST